MYLYKVFLYFGLFFIGLSLLLLWERNNPYRLAFTSSVNLHQITTKSSNPPVRLVINSLNIDLPVIPSKITDKQWGTVTSGASWLESSPIPGNTGNSILYGHNWTNLLGSLVQIKPGASLQIIDKAGGRKAFLVTSTAIVSPNDLHVLDQSTDKRITIYTCTGLFDQKRFIAVALLQKTD